MRNPLKRKKQKNSVNGKQLGDPSVSMARSKKARKERPKQSPFRNGKKSKKNKKKYKRRKPVNLTIIVGVIGGIISLAIIGFLVYQGARWVVSTRASKVIREEQISGNVIGFKNLPTYPESEYIFYSNENEDAVKEFTATGRSVYRLDWTEEIEDVFQYYEDELPERGWDHVLSVERTSKESLYGEYWVNEEDKIGVRIYDRVNDVWYERITVEQAKNGLSEIVQAEAERELIISSDTGEELLPDFPWELSIPKEYLTKYYHTDEGDLRGIEFFRIDSNDVYLLEPIKKLDGSLDDIYFEEFLSIINLRLEELNETYKWEPISSKYIDIAGKVVLEGAITSSKGEGRVYILHNDRVEYAYAIFQPHDDPTFSNFLLRNLKEKKADYTGDEFLFGD